MANLYTQVDSNIRKTWLYLFFFSLILISIGWILSIYFDSLIIVFFFLLFSIVINFFSYWNSDKIVLKITNSKPIEKNDNPELYRIVENLSITAGIEMPKLYIMEEAQPNAFATGRDPKRGVIVVTRGLLDILDKSELEGVIAHELAHIGNRDILLSTIIVVLVGMIVMVTDFFFRYAFWGGGRRGGKDKGNVMIVVAALALAILAPILAQLMKMAVSRKREFLADASGALLTRYPDGLARALEKISANPTPMKKANDATAHLFISSPFKGKEKGKFMHRLFATHPPVEERIAKLKGIKL